MNVLQQALLKANLVTEADVSKVNTVKEKAEKKKKKNGQVKESD